MSGEATVSPSKRSGAGRPYDHGKRRRSLRQEGRTDIRVTIPGEVLTAAGIDPHGPAPFYRLSGYKRSRNGHTVIVSLYTEA
jgi:hypothetical protein